MNQRQYTPKLPEDKYNALLEAINRKARSDKKTIDVDREALRLLIDDHEALWCIITGKNTFGDDLKQTGQYGT